MPTLDGAVVLITGANGGIGTEFVREALDLGWHADQLHRLGAGLEPDLGRGRLATVSLVRRNGRTVLQRKRGS